MPVFFKTMPILLLLNLNACVSYQPKPLALAVNAPLNSKQLTLQAGQLKNPLIKPLVFNLSDGLSSDEAAVLAVLNNPELQLARNKLNIAQAQLIQAGLLPNPRLSYNIADTTGGLEAGKVMAYGFNLEWEVTALLTRYLKIAAASAEQKAINLQIAWQEWQVAQAAKLACYQVRIYQQQQPLFADNVQLINQQQARLQQAENLGLINPLERILLATLQNNAQIKLQKINQETQLQQQRLQRILGLKAENIVRLQVINPVFNVSEAAVNSQSFMEQRLDLLALKQSYEAQEQQLNREVLQQFPKISLGLTQTKNNSNYYTMGAGISISLPLFDRNQGAIALASANRAQVMAEYNNRVFQTQADIVQLQTLIANLKQQINTTEILLVDLTQLLSAYEKAAALGQVDNMAYYTALNTVTDKRFELLNLQLNLLNGQVGLQTALGQLL